MKCFEKCAKFGTWLPIDTAPKDGEIILLYRPTAFEWGKVAPAIWIDDKYAKQPKPFWEIWLKIGGVRESRAWKPTHWMPLPEAPCIIKRRLRR